MDPILFLAEGMSSVVLVVQLNLCIKTLPINYPRKNLRIDKEYSACPE